MNKIHCVYKISNIINDKLYIGRNEQFDRRWKEHQRIARGGKIKYPKLFHVIHATMNCHNINNFSIIKLQEFDNKKLCCEAEKRYIKELNTLTSGNGYNITKGGEYGIVWTPEFAAYHKTTIPRGENSPNTHLTEKKVWEMICMYETGEFSMEQVASQYGIKGVSFGDILRGNSWAHLNYDYVPRDRFNRGEKNQNSSLTEHQVIEIITLYKTNQYSIRQLAKMFNVSHPSIGNILNNKTWKHINREVL